MKPLVITDCDEVLLHMVSHFGTWLGEAHDVDFTMHGSDFASALTRRSDGEVLARDDVWPLLNGFFATEMHRQTLVPGAREALERLASRADVVVLTNLLDTHQEARTTQLRALGIDYPVFTNQGGKGEPVVRIVEQFTPSATVFIDDLAIHHASVAQHAPDVWRLHMIAESAIAENMPPATDAHARIDDWATALPWIEDRLRGEPL